MNATATAPTLAWAAATDKGPRKDNQDRVVVSPANHPQLDHKGVLLVLCDGVGGEEGGHIAASMASQAALRSFYDNPSNDAGAALPAMVEHAWQAVRDAAANGAQFSRMATTLVAAAVQNGVLHMAHVGDSRGYLFRGGKLTQLTDDHTYVNAQLSSGVITQEEALRSVYRGVLTRSLGAATDHTPAFCSEPLQPGDRILLCSDGVHGAVDARAMERVLSEQLDEQRAASALIAMALENRTGDNATVALLNYGVAAQRATATLAAAGGAARKRGVGAPAIMGGLVVLAGAALAVAGASGLLRGTPIDPAALFGTQPLPTATSLSTTATLSPSATAKSASAATRAPVNATTLPGARATAEPTAADGATSTVAPLPSATATRRPTAVPSSTPTPAPTQTPPPTLTAGVTVVPVAPQPQPQPQPQPTSQPPAPTSPPENPLPPAENPPPVIPTAIP